MRAHIEDKMITANIVLPDETYHIEVSHMNAPSLAASDLNFFFQRFLQPSWRHLPHLSDRHMVVYKQSDVKLSWEANSTNEESAFPKMCGYVKEGAGETLCHLKARRLFSQYPFVSVRIGNG